MPKTDWPDYAENAKPSRHRPLARLRRKRSGLITVEGDNAQRIRAARARRERTTWGVGAMRQDALPTAGRRQRLCRIVASTNGYRFSLHK
jgi:hypothetical protein